MDWVGRRRGEAAGAPAARTGVAASGGCGRRDRSGHRQWWRLVVVWAARSSTSISQHAPLGRPWEGWMERVSRGERGSMARRGGGGQRKEIRRRRESPALRVQVRGSCLLQVMTIIRQISEHTRAATTRLLPSSYNIILKLNELKRHNSWNFEIPQS